jgi:TP901-1 family phage major tail protein
MAVQKGSALLVKIGNAGSPEAFTTVAGLRDTSISINSETIDVTNKDSARVRTLLADAGIKSFSISGSGVFTDGASEQSVLTAFSSATFSNFEFTIPSFNKFTGSFQVTALEYSGTYNDAVQYSMSFESAGAVTIATV